LSEVFAFSPAILAFSPWSFSRYH